MQTKHLKGVITSPLPCFPGKKLESARGKSRVTDPLSKCLNAANVPKEIPSPILHLKREFLQKIFEN